MPETYIAKPIEFSVINELNVVINNYKLALKNGISFRDVSLAHRALQQKLSQLIECRNKNIEEAIPSRAFDNAIFMVTTSGCTCEFHVQIDTQIEGLINEALELSYNFYKSYIVYK